MERRVVAVGMGDSRLARWIDAVIAMFAVGFLGCFIAILIVCRDRPAAHQPTPREMLAIVPVSAEQPVTRSFDQIKGVMEGLADLERVSVVVRAEYFSGDKPTPEELAVQLATMASQLVSPLTGAIIAPGTSKDLRAIFIDGCSKEPMLCARFHSLLILAISSTATSLRTDPRPSAPDMRFAMVDNQGVARAIAQKVVEDGYHVEIDFDTNDKTYAENLRDEVTKQIATVHLRGDLLAPMPGKLRTSYRQVLIGNDNWLRKRIPPDRLGDVETVILGDGLNDRQTLDIVTAEYPGVRLLCVMPDVKTAMDLVDGKDWEHLENQQFMWNHIARYAAQIVGRIVTNELNEDALHTIPFVLKECTPVTKPLRDNPPLAYALIVAFTGMAKGLWQGAYAWFLSSQLQLSATQIGLVIGAQFIFQIVLEMPSGAWADRGRTRRVLAYAHLAFAGYCCVYLLAAHGHLTGKPAVALAFGAEALFGIGAALYSGTLEAWIGERERAASNENARAFAQRLRRVHSLSSLWGSVPCALFGGIAFAIATRGFPELPWLLGGAGYLVAFGVTMVSVVENTRSGKPPPTIDVVQMVGGQVSRAISFLREQPKTFRLFMCSSLAYMPFFATQLFWIPFLAKTLNVRAGDTLGHGDVPLLGQLSLLAALWCGGEMARSLGGLALFAGKTPTARRSLFHIILALLTYAAAIVLQVLAVLLDRYEIVLFALGHVFARFAEGRLRRELSVLKDRWILSERGTLQSLDALLKAIVGLVFLTLVGALIELDPILGYCVIAGTAFAAAFEMFKLRSSIDDDVPIEMTGGRRRPTRYRNWLSLFRRFLGSRYLWYTVIVFLLAVFPLLQPPNTLPVWSALNEHSVTGAVVDIHALSESNVRAAPDMRRDLHADHLVRTTWRVTGGTKDNKVGCRLPLTDPFDLWEANLEKKVRARIHSIDGGYVLDFAVDPEGSLDRPNSKDDRATRIVFSPSVVDKIMCFRLEPGSDIDLAERLVIPTRIRPLSQQALAGAAMVLPEMIIAFVIVSLLVGAAFWVSRVQLQDVLDLAPAALLDGAREHAGVAASQILVPTEGLPIRDFEPFQDLLDQLDATSFIIGGFSEELDPATNTGNRLSHLWYHEYGEAILDLRAKPDNARIAAWVVTHWDKGDGADSRTQRLSQPVDQIDTRYWPIRGSQSGAEELASLTGFLSAVSRSQDPPHTRFAACAVVRRPDRDAPGKRNRCGFAIAVFSGDRASRYISPVDRQLLLMLAEIARLQAERARLNTDLWNEIHLAKGEFDRIRIPLERIEGIFEENVTSSDMPGAALALTGVINRVKFMHGRLEHRLYKRPRRTGERQPSMLAEVRRIAGEFTVSESGAMEVAVDNRLPDGDDVMVGWSALFILQGALTELLWNAAKHGGTLAAPDVDASITIEPAGDSIRFTITNRLPEDYVYEGEVDGWGMTTLAADIAGLHGEFTKFRFDPETRTGTVVFGLPRRSLTGDV